MATISDKSGSSAVNLPAAVTSDGITATRSSFDPPVSYEHALKSFKWNRLWEASLALVGEMESCRLNPKDVAYAKVGRWQAIWEIFRASSVQGIKVHTTAYNTAIRACAQLRPKPWALELLGGLEANTANGDASSSKAAANLKRSPLDRSDLQSGSARERTEKTSRTRSTATKQREAKSSSDSSLVLKQHLAEALKRGVEADTALRIAHAAKTTRHVLWQGAFHLFDDLLQRGYEAEASSYYVAARAVLEGSAWERAIAILSSARKAGFAEDEYALGVAVVASSRGEKWRGALDVLRKATQNHIEVSAFLSDATLRVVESTGHTLGLPCFPELLRTMSCWISRKVRHQRAVFTIDHLDAHDCFDRRTEILYERQLLQNALERLRIETEQLGRPGYSIFPEAFHFEGACGSSENKKRFEALPYQSQREGTGDQFGFGRKFTRSALELLSPVTDDGSTSSWDGALADVPRAIVAQLPPMDIVPLNPTTNVLVVWISSNLVLPVVGSASVLSRSLICMRSCVGNAAGGCKVPSLASWSEALSLVRGMDRTRLAIDGATWSAAIRVCSLGGAWTIAYALLTGARESGEANLGMFKGLLAAFAKTTLFEQALDIVSSMRADGFEVARHDYSSGIAACFRGQHWAGALSLLHLVREETTAVDLTSYCSTLDACSKNSQVDASAVILEWIKKGGFKMDTRAQNVVINGHGKRGDWESALSCLWAVGYNAPAPSLITLSSAMSACTKASQWHVSLQLLGKFGEFAITPDAVAFGNSMQACAAGRCVVAAADLRARMQQICVRPTSAAKVAFRQICNQKL